MRIDTSRLIIEDVGPTPNPKEFVRVFNSNPEFIGAAYQFADKRSYDLSDVRRYLFEETFRENSHCLAIRLRETGELVGTAAFVAPQPEVPSPWIGLLIIDRERQGQGLGTEAARALEHHFIAEGWTAIRLTVLQALPEARRFWERLGYVVYEERQDEKERPCWQMRKVLPPKHGHNEKSQ